MSAETDLYAALSASSALATIVGSRIYPDAIPEDQAPPAVVYQRANTAPVVTINGVALAEEVRFSITAWAKTRATADSAADAIAAAVVAAVAAIWIATGATGPHATTTAAASYKQAVS